MRGPKPKPTELKLVRGAQPCRINSDEPKPASGRPECPAYVADNPEALAEWERIIPQLEAMKVLTQADGAALATYCMIHARYLKAIEESKSGLTISTGTGSSKPNPAITIAERCEASLFKAMAEFGLTPSSRSRIRVNAKQESQLDAFIKQRPKRSG